MLLDRDGAGLARLVSELGGEPPVAVREVDLSDLDAVDAAARELTAEHPDIDLLLAGAGLDRAQSMLALDWRQARDDFTVNSLSNLVLLSHLAPAMAARGDGHVTAIISLAGVVGMPYEAPYSASKAALASIAESARAELEPKGITFTAVFPGFVDTPMFRANAFKKPSNDTSQSRRLRHRAGTTYPVDPRDAAERIYLATLRRREQLAFPMREYAKVKLASMLPARLRDRLTRRAMSPPADIGSRPMSDDLARLDATAQAELVRTGEASPGELVEAAIGRIEALNPELNAVIHPLFEEARDAAAGELPDGPFKGVPFLLKDLVAASAGHPFHLGMKFLRDLGLTANGRHRARRALPRAGFVIVRQDQHAGARHPADHRARGARPDPQPVGYRRAPPAARAAARRRRSPPGWSRSRTRTTAAARSGSRPAPAAWSG